MKKTEIELNKTILEIESLKKMKDSIEPIFFLRKMRTLLDRRKELFLQKLAENDALEEKAQ